MGKWINETFDLIEAIIYKLNGNKIDQFNNFAETVRRNINEKISKIFTKILDNGLQHIEKMFREKGIDISNGPIPQNPENREMLNEVLSIIINLNQDYITYLMHSSSFAQNSCVPIVKKEFIEPLFYRLSLLGILLFTVADWPSGPYSLIRYVVLIFSFLIFINFLLYIPSYLKKRKRKIEQEKRFLEEEFERIIKG